jgi:hypothetical protein
MISISFLFALICVCLFIVVCVAVSIWGFAHSGGDQYNYEVSPRLCAWGGLGAAVVTLIVSIIPGVGFYPFSYEYHSYHVHGGTVEKISSRILGSSDSIEQKFVVQFQGDTTMYGCQDTRCANVHVGDQLSLKCKKVYQWAATPGYDCHWYKWVPAK